MIVAIFTIQPSSSLKTEPDLIKNVFLNMGKVKTAKVNYATPGEPMTQEEFEKMIAEAEKGPFHTIKDVKAEVAKWKVKYSK